MVPFNSSGIGLEIALPLKGIACISVDRPFRPKGSPHKGWGILSMKCMDKHKSWFPLLGKWKSPVLEEWEGRVVVEGG